MRVLVTHRDRQVVRLVTLVLRRVYAAIDLDEREREEFATPDSLVDVLDRCYDAIIFPLTLPNFNSLRLAEYAHAARSDTSLILVTESASADFDALRALFDHVLGMPFEFDDLIKSVGAGRARQALTNAEVERYVSRLLDTARCFWDFEGDDYGGRHPELLKITKHDLGDYRHAAKNRSSGQVERLAKLIGERGLPEYRGATRGNVFISYSHADRQWLDRLQVHLKPIEREGRLVRWDDTELKPGAKWETDIIDAINSAKVIVLLVTAEFLASDFIATTELPLILRVAEERGAKVLPVIVSSCMWPYHPLATFQAANSPATPLATLPRRKREAALADIAAKIFHAFVGGLTSR